MTDKSYKEFEKPQLRETILKHIKESLFLTSVNFGKKKQQPLFLHVQQTAPKFIASDKFHKIECVFTKPSIEMFKTAFPDIKFGDLKGYFLIVKKYKILHHFNYDPQTTSTLPDPTFHLFIQNFTILFYNRTQTFGKPVELIKDVPIKTNIGSLKNAYWREKLLEEQIMDVIDLQDLLVKNSVKEGKPVEINESPQVDKIRKSTAYPQRVVGSVINLFPKGKKEREKKKKLEEDKFGEEELEEIGLDAKDIASRADIAKIEKQKEKERYLHADTKEVDLEIEEEKILPGPKFKKPPTKMEEFFPERKRTPKKGRGEEEKEFTSPRDIKEAISSMLKGEGDTLVKGKESKGKKSEGGKKQRMTPMGKEKVCLTEDQFLRFLKWKKVYDVQRKIDADVTSQLEGKKYSKITAKLHEGKTGKPWTPLTGKKRAASPLHLPTRSTPNPKRKKK
jgi:hypothetical protein